MASALEDFHRQAVLITVSLVIFSGVSSNNLAQGAGTLLSMYIIIIIVTTDYAILKNPCNSAT